MFPTPVRQPASGKQRETEWPSQSTFYLAERHRSSRLSWSPVRAWNSRSGCTARGAHMLIASPHTPQSSLTKEMVPSAPSLTWKLAVQNTNIIWWFFPLPPSPVQPLVSRLACRKAGGSQVWTLPQRLGVRAMVSPAARDTAHALHKFGPTTDPLCSPHLGEVGWGQGRRGHPPAAMPPPSAPSLLSLEQPALANKSSWCSSKATLMGVYPKHWDINKLINTENT